MIQLTRLNASRLAVNSDLIKFIEEAPDTVLTLINGEKLVVREGMAEVIELVREFRRSICSCSRMAEANSCPSEQSGTAGTTLESFRGQE